jgi:hypothetical protein
MVCTGPWCPLLHSNSCKRQPVGCSIANACTLSQPAAARLANNHRAGGTGSAWRLVAEEGVGGGAAQTLHAATPGTQQSGGNLHKLGARRGGTSEMDGTRGTNAWMSSTATPPSGRRVSVLGLDSRGWAHAPGRCRSRKAGPTCRRRPPQTCALQRRSLRTRRVQAAPEPLSTACGNCQRSVRRGPLKWSRTAGRRTPVAAGMSAAQANSAEQRTGHALMHCSAAGLGRPWRRVVRRCAASVHEDGNAIPCITHCSANTCPCVFPPYRQSASPPEPSPLWRSRAQPCQWCLRAAASGHRTHCNTAAINTQS